MEAQFGYQNLLQVMPFASDENANNMPLSSQDYVYQQYCTPAAENNEMPPFPPSLPHWVDFQQTSHSSYVDYFAESCVPLLQREMPLLPYSEPEAATGFYLNDYSSGPFVPKGNRSSLSHSRLSSGPPLYSRKPLDPASRQRATAADRSRKLRNAERLDALHKLLPHPKKGGQASKLDDIIDHIKYLQLQIKDLSQSRLVGESTSNPSIFLEGYGHYLVHELMMSNESLEEKMGKLLEGNPLAAIQLLQSRSLFMMPMHLAQGLN